MATPEEKQFFEVVEQNDLDAVKRFIEEKGIRVSLTNFKQQTAAHIAAENGNLPLLEYLISRDKELLVATDERNFFVLHIAVKKGFIDIVKYLIENTRVDIFAPEHRFCGDTAVHTAAEEDQLAILKYFLEDRKVDVNVKDGLGASPLFLAAEKVRMRIIRYLVEDMKADATMIDFQRDNILYRSAAIGDLSVPKYLLDERNIKIDVDWTDNFGRTIVQSAARHNELDFIKYFVEQKNANYEIANKSGNTALHEAASEGHLDVVKYLVEKGAQVDRENKRGKTPSDMAKDTFKSEVVQYLNEVTKIRSRRNAFAFEPTRYPTFETKSPQTGLFYNSIQRIFMNSPVIAGQENRLDESSSKVSSSNLHSLVLIANIMLKNSKHLDNSNGRKIDLLSPRTIVDNKIDPLAMSAVTDDYYFSAP